MIRNISLRKAVENFQKKQRQTKAPSWPGLITNVSPHHTGSQTPPVLEKVWNWERLIKVVIYFQPSIRPSVVPQIVPMIVTDLTKPPPFVAKKGELSGWGFIGLFKKTSFFEIHLLASSAPTAFGAWEQSEKMGG
jgi:hypothetical protein